MRRFVRRGPPPSSVAWAGFRRSTCSPWKPRFDTHIRIRCPSQVFAECGSFSMFNINYSLIDCGGAFSKQLTSEQPAYTAAALKIAGGDERPADGESGTVNVVGHSVVGMSGSLLASSGGGTGVEMTSGGASSGSDLMTSFRAYNSAIYGFDTDLRKDTEGSWEAQPIYDVMAAAHWQNPDKTWPPGLIIKNISISGGDVRVYAYVSDSNRVMLAERSTLDFSGLYTGIAAPHTVLAIKGPMGNSAQPPFNGSKAVMDVYVHFDPRTPDSSTKGMFISLPPQTEVASGEAIAFIVGSDGATFGPFNWDWTNECFTGSADGLDPNTVYVAKYLASEWAEVSVRATSYSSTEGIITVHPSFPVN